MIPRRSSLRTAFPEKLAKRSFFDPPNFVGRVQLISIRNVFSVRTGRFDQLQCDLAEVSLTSVVEVVLLCWLDGILWPSCTLPQGGSNPRSVVRGGEFLVIPRRSILRTALPEKLAKRSFFDPPNFAGRVQVY